MHEPTIRGVPFSQCSSDQLRGIITGSNGIFVYVPRPHPPEEDPAVSRLYAEILLRERGL